MLYITVSDVPFQTINATLASQACTINLYQRRTGFYCDLYVNNSLVIGGVACHHLNKIVRDSYLGFTGDLTWQDTQGTDDPTSPGLGSRWLFIYLETSDL